MPDQYLVGNGRWCSCCFPDGRPTGAEWQRFRDRPISERRGCNECVGAGRIAFAAEEIIAIQRTEFPQTGACENP